MQALPSPTHMYESLWNVKTDPDVSGYIVCVMLRRLRVMISARKLHLTS